MAEKGGIVAEKKKRAGPPTGNAGKGRPKGSKNKTTTLLREAILLAAENVGNDIRPDDGLVAYLEQLAVVEPKAFASLLGRVLPLQVTGADGEAVKTEVTISFS